jgi:general secretion pathway protein F
MQRKVLRLLLAPSIVASSGRGRRQGSTAGNFPPMLVPMLPAGGPEMLARCAGQQQQEVSNRLSIVVSLLEPLLLLLIGGAVLSIVIAVLQPIIEMNQMLR